MEYIFAVDCPALCIQEVNILHICIFFSFMKVFKIHLWSHPSCWTGLLIENGITLDKPPAFTNFDQQQFPNIHTKKPIHSKHLHKSCNNVFHFRSQPSNTGLCLAKEGAGSTGLGDLPFGGLAIHLSRPKRAKVDPLCKHSRVLGGVNFSNWNSSAKSERYLRLLSFKDGWKHVWKTMSE